MSDDQAGGSGTRAQIPGLFAAFERRYAAAYELASNIERNGRWARVLARTLLLTAIALILLNVALAQDAGPPVSHRSGDMKPGLFGLALLPVAGGALVVWLRARTRAAFIRTQVDAALFVAPGLTDEEKLKIAGVMGH